MNPIVQEDIEAIVQQVGVPLYDLEGKTVLISGACGFLGSWFVAVIQHLNKSMFIKPVTVLAVDSFIATEKENHIVKVEDKNIVLIESDISNIEQFRNITKNREIDYIIHAAGIASPIYYRKYPIETIDGMVLGLSNLLKYAALYPVSGFLNFSSSEMYGNPHPDKVPTAETYYGNVSATGPRSCYDESKRMGEAMCVSYHRIHNIPVKTVRPFNVYGPGMRKVDDRVVPKFIFSALQGMPITVHVPGVQTRTFCYITDAMVGFFKTLLVGRSGEAYNIGIQDGEISMVELAERVQKLFKDKIVINKVEMPTEYPQDQAQRRCPDITKARTELLYNPQIMLDKGLTKTLQWCYTVINSKFYEPAQSKHHNPGSQSA